MLNKELQDILKKWPDDLLILVSDPVQGDCENCKEMYKENIEYDSRYPAIVLFL